jgi:glutamate-1-semialdehyde aminotransferase
MPNRLRVNGGDPPENDRSRYSRSEAWFARARAVIPGAFHLTGRRLLTVGTAPLYFERAWGCRAWDVDGHEYVDFLMAYGSSFLGYARPEVEDAAYARAGSGRLFSMNDPKHVEFIEALLPRFPGMQMGTFFRSGSEATTAALRVARRATGRRRIARCGYHGWHDWCLPLEDFVPAGLDSQVPEFDANRPETLAELFARYPGEIAAVILAPEMVLPHAAEPFHRIQQLCRTHGAVFVLDEVKTGIRIAPNSVAERVGVVPDLLTVGKALANGFAVAALLGRREVMQSAAGMHLSATFHGDTAGMAAALETLRIVDACDAQAHVMDLGQRLIHGLNQAAREAELPAQAFGEPLPPMPFFKFTHADPVVNEAMTQTFYAEVLSRGVLLHPRHMWFISLAHQQSDIERTLDIAATAMRVTARTHT